MRDDHGEGARIIKNRLVIAIATGGGVGFLPVAPGTWGSLLGLLLFVCLAPLPLALYCLVLAGLIGAGIWAAGAAERLWARKDASAIVIDEIAGMLLTLTALPLTWTSLVTGFVCFRLFDILKPLPQLERLPGGWGVMLDDLCAGVLAHASVRLIMLLV